MNDKIFKCAKLEANDPNPWLKTHIDVYLTENNGCFPKDIYGACRASF